MTLSFFFSSRRRHTSSKRDWSSDVCSSDLDLRGGQCVRLRQGDYQQETVFGADPAAMARRWVDEGAEVLHIVDLDGAKEGRPVNGPSIRAIVKASGVPCQLGGGLRTDKDITGVL